MQMVEAVRTVIALVEIKGYPPILMERAEEALAGTNPDALDLVIRVAEAAVSAGEVR